MRPVLTLFLAAAMSGCTAQELALTAFDLARTGGEPVRHGYRLMRGYELGDNPLSGTYKVEFELPDGANYTLYFRTLDRPNLAIPGGGVQTFFSMAPTLAELPAIDDMAAALDTLGMGGVMYQKALPSSSSDAIDYGLTFHSGRIHPEYEPLLEAIGASVRQRRSLEPAPPTFVAVDLAGDPAIIESVQYAHDSRTLLYRYRATRLTDEALVVR
jgi:hypothetical protein